MKPHQVAFVRHIYEDRGCLYCDYLNCAMKWWDCEKKHLRQGYKYIPPVFHCPYWKPDKVYIKKVIKCINNGFRENLYGVHDAGAVLWYSVIVYGTHSRQAMSDYGRRKERQCVQALL